MIGCLSTFWSVFTEREGYKDDRLDQMESDDTITFEPFLFPPLFVFGEALQQTRLVAQHVCYYTHHWYLRRV